MTDAASDADAAELVCDASRPNLAEVLAFVDHACARAGLDGTVAFDLRLATEEVEPADQDEERRHQPRYGPYRGNHDHWRVRGRQRQ